MSPPIPAAPDVQPAALAGPVLPQYARAWQEICDAIARHGDRLPVELTQAQAHYESVRDRVPTALALKYHNWFGIKQAKDNRFQAGAVQYKTKEWTEAGKEYGITDGFATYTSPDQAVEDLIRIVSQEAFRKHLPANPPDKVEAWAKAFVRYGYSTKPSYATELIGRMNWLRLQRPLPPTPKPKAPALPSRQPAVVPRKDTMFSKIKDLAAQLFLRLIGVSLPSLEDAARDGVEKAEQYAKGRLSPEKLKAALEAAKAKLVPVLDAAINVPLFDSLVDKAVDRALTKLIDQIVAGYNRLYGQDWGALLEEKKPALLQYVDDKAGLSLGKIVQS